jgi:hypothetical protein
MRQFIVSATGTGTTEWSPVDRRGSGGDDYLVVVNMENGEGVVDFEFSPERPGSSGADSRSDPTIILQHDVLKDLTESCASTMVVPFQAFRLNVKDYKNGTITAVVVQGGIHGN